MSNKLIIIGNGFELFHGIESTYYNFLEYLEENISDDFLKGIQKYIESDELWCNFEQALGMLDYDILKENASTYLIGYGDDDWRDSANHDYQNEILEELKFANQISNYFTVWINNLNNNVKRKLSKKKINNSSLYLNFNYTDTLERVYGIKRGKILYIHGNAIEDDKLIVGHGNNSYFITKQEVDFNSDEEYERYIEDEQELDFRESEGELAIKKYFKRTYKDTTKIVNQNIHFFKRLIHIKEIFVLGHSLSNIDLAYYREIVNHINHSNCVWYVSYYTELEYSDHIQQLKGIGIHENNITMIKLKKLLRKRYK